MKIENIQPQNPYFGMSLNIKNKHLSPSVIKKIEQKKFRLDSMSKDVNVTIKPDDDYFGRAGKSDYIKITVEDKNISILEKVLSIIKLRHPYKRTDLYTPYEIVKFDTLVSGIYQQKQIVHGKLKL